MNISVILEMVASAGDLARSAAGRFRGHPAVLYPGTSHLADLVNHHLGALVLRDLNALLDGTPVPVEAPQDREAVAALIYTSGTTAVLRHRHLLAELESTHA